MRKFDLFWTHHPAFLYALSWYLGCLLGETKSLVLIPLMGLYLYICLPEKRVIACSCFLLAFLYGVCFVKAPGQEHESLQGYARVEVSSIQSICRYGKWAYAIQLDVHSFSSKETIFKNFPCSMIQNDAKRMCGGVEYGLPCLLSNRDGRWVLKPLAKQSEWHVLKKTFSLVEWRYKVKNALKRWFARNIPPGDCRDFLQGVFLGEFSSARLARGFAQCGLQHVLVVSGFHFSLLLFSFSLLCRVFLPRNIAMLCLFFLSVLYFVVIGPTAPVLRAWCVVAIVILSKIAQERTNSVNSLGIALVIVLMLQPTWVTSVGFQLSFLATFAILLLSSPIYQFLKRFFPQYQAVELARFCLFDQLVIILSSCIQKAFACACSVVVATWPLLLFVFGQVSVQSIVYNCFFPCLVAALMFMTVVAALFCWLEPVGKFLFSVVDISTQKLLSITSEVPLWMDHSIRFELPYGVVILYYVVLFAVSLLLWRKRFMLAAQYS
jgi:competence protein ComEC